MLKKSLLILSIFLNLLLITGCDNTDSSDQPDGSTVLLYEGNNMKMDSSPSFYSLSLKPLDVSAYEQIRIVTYINSGAGMINVQVIEVNEAGESIGILDTFNLDPGSTGRYTAVYDVPGRRIMVSYSSATPVDKYVSCFIYAR